jgi:WD40 repeat protein
MSPDGLLLASGNAYSVQLWSLPDGALINTLHGIQPGAICSVISPNGRLLAIRNSYKVWLWRLPDGSLLNKLETRSWGFYRNNNCLAINPSGRLLVSEDADAAVRLWSLPDGLPIKTLKGHMHGVECLAISPNGKLLASGSMDYMVRLWSLPDGSPIKTLYGHPGAVNCLAISPDGRLLASGCADEAVRLWSLPDGALIKTLKGHRGAIESLTISQDGRLLASGSRDRTVRLWTLNPIRLCHLPIAMASQDDFEWVQETLREGKIAESARPGLEFIATLMRRRRRFDIAIEESRPRIEAGEFDIEIAG